MQVSKDEIEHDYLQHTRKFFQRLENLCRQYPVVGSMWVPKEMTWKGNERQKWVLLQEFCDQEDFKLCGMEDDRWGNCCVIKDKYNR